MAAVRRATIAGSVLFVLACGADFTAAPVTATPTPATATPSSPSLASGNTPQTAVAGASFLYDASKGGTAFVDPAGKGLTYTISLSGATTGFSANGSLINGTPTAPGVTKVTVTATDALGRMVVDQFSIVAFAAGLNNPVLPLALYRYSDATSPLPAHFSASVNGVTVTSTDNTPPDNAITDAGATLGRVLFYDPRLSANDGTACASCHVQSLGFADATPLSVGFAQASTARHTPSLANARYYARKRFFWDERAATLEEQVLAPIQNPDEMGLALDALVLKVGSTPYYAALFTAAFGSNAVTSDRIARALAQYTRSMVSGASRYDKAFTSTGTTNFPAFLTAEEQTGEGLFRTTGCAACHSAIAQVSDSVHNIGLDATITDAGAGNGAFKAPSLRNVAVRAPYMHDGRFASLEQVVDFFDAGVQPNPALDTRLKNANGSVKRLNLTTAQKSALVAFMKTLTDSAFLTDVRFSDPFALATPPALPPVNPGAAVSIRNKAYNPPALTVAAGTIVTWTNLDNTRHSAQFDDASIVSTPIFTSGSRTVTMPVKAGTYTYHCAIHGAAMSGVVTVR